AVVCQFSAASAFSCAALRYCVTSAIPFLGLPSTPYKAWKLRTPLISTTPFSGLLPSLLAQRRAFSSSSQYVCTNLFVLVIWLPSQSRGAVSASVSSSMAVSTSTSNAIVTRSLRGSSPSGPVQPLQLAGTLPSASSTTPSCCGWLVTWYPVLRKSCTIFSSPTRLCCWISRRFFCKLCVFRLEINNDTTPSTTSVPSAKVIISSIKLNPLRFIFMESPPTAHNLQCWFCNLRRCC